MSDLVPVIASPSETLSDLAIAECASEPIRFPGAIQPHGHLIAFDPVTLIVQHVSAAIAPLAGRRVDQILGVPLDDWLGANDALSFRRALTSADPLDDESPIALALNGALFDATLHRVSGLSVLELEPFLFSAFRSEPVLARALRKLQSVVDLPALQEVTVREVRALTGFDRVVIYAFTPDGHGHVVAEAKAPDMPAYLGLHFPASDIPAQARELYKQNWLRMIPDVDYEPVQIVGLQSATSGAPLDLSAALLRSVSPIHREYMRHMGARASLSISLLKNGELWGLISCVHRAPKHIARDARTACLSIGRLLSMQIAALEGLRDSKAIESTHSLLAPLLEAMRDSPDDVLESLAAEPHHLMALTGASGAAVVIDDRVIRCGAAPAEQDVRALAAWVARQSAGRGLFVTADLPRQYAPAAVYADKASGLMAIMLPKPVANMVLWFRPDVAGSVSWAGDPDKSPTLDPGTGAPRLSPRHSFEAWQTLRHHQAAEWEFHQIHAARGLRRSTIELDLAIQVLKGQRAVALRDELVAVVSHDLRSPMTVVALQASTLMRALIADTGAPSRRMLAAAQTIQRATVRMNEMLRDLLDLSAIEQGRYGVDLRTMPVESIFEDAGALLMALAETKRITLGFDCPAGLVVDADGERIYQVIANLVGNALKFTPEGGTVTVDAAIDATDATVVKFRVIDSGCGMRPDQLAHIFERYWRVRDANPTGTGLGLYISRGIVLAHAGTITAQSEVGVGSTFAFTLKRSATPLQSTANPAGNSA